MNHITQAFESWIKHPDFGDTDKNLTALYLQVISLIAVLFMAIILVMYVLYGDMTFSIFHVLSILIHTAVIILIRFKRLQLASNLFILAGLGLLTIGILVAGSIHASTALMYPILLVYASLLLNRRAYFGFGILCLLSIALAIYAENQKLLPAYKADPPELPLFLSYAFIIVATGIVIRFITENLKSNLQRVRRYAEDLSVQKSMLDRVGQAVVACKKDNTVIYWNQAATDLYGWQESDVLGRSYLEVLPVQIPQEMSAQIRTTLRSDKVWAGEIMIQKRDKSWVRILGTLSPLKDPTGTISGWIGIAADLTARERMEFELRQREALLKVVAEVAGLFLNDPDWYANINILLERLGKTIHATHAYLFETRPNLQKENLSPLRYEWTAPGYSNKLAVSDFHAIALQEDGFDEYRQTFLSGQPFSGSISSFTPVENEFFSKQGIKAIVEMPLFVNGQWWGIIGFDDCEQEREWSNAELDVLKVAAGILVGAIQRQDAEAAIHESERIYRQSIEAADSVPYYQDYESNSYLFMGDGIYQLTGYRADEMKPELWFDIVQETVMLGDAAGLKATEAVELVRQGKLKSWQCDQRIRTRDGRIRWLTDRSIELIGNSGVSIGSIGMLQDITERKLTEERLRQREIILEAMTFSAEQFLRSSNWRENIDAVLERLGKALDANHAYLFERHVNMDGKIVTSMSYEWTAPGFDSDLEKPYYQNFIAPEAGLERLYEILDRGEPLIAGPSFLTESEKDYLSSINIKSMLEMRIVVNDEQWGTIGFDDMENERDWTSAEVDVIKVAASILGAAIKRQMDEDALQNELIERKRTEQALLFSEQKFSQVFHTTPVLMTLEDDDNRLVDVNNSFLEALEYTRDELIGHRPYEFNLISFPEDIEALQRRRDEDGVIKDIEIRIRSRSGKILTVLMSIEYLYVSNTRYILTSALDITERKLAEEKYRSIFDNSIDGIFQSTVDGRFINMNAAMARIYGYDSPDDMLHSVNDIGVQIYVNSSQRDEVRRRLNAGEKLVGYETLDYRKDGSEFWSSMSVQAIFDESGKVLYYEGTLEDITLRKKAETEREALIQLLADKNAEAETLRETTSIVTSTLDVDEAVGRILEQLKRVIPYDSASVWLYEGNVARLVGADGLVDMPSMGMQFVSDDTEPDYRFLTDDIAYILFDDIQEYYPQFREPRVSYIHGWLSVVLKARGKVIGFISLDSRTPGRFTEHDAHLALNFANQVSIALENARLFSDLQKELDHRRKLITELEEKNTELEQFTYTVSHDLKSPLVTINGFLGYLEEDAASGNIERLRRDTQRIEEAVHKMQKLLNELLELSRVGRIMNPPQAVPFVDLVQDAVENVRGRLDERKVTLQTQPNLPIVYVDRPRLVEVLQNLLDNAAKYMGGQSSPHIEIGTRGEDKESRHFIFYVQDNGMGIPTEHFERVFGLFNKLDAKSEGTGIGLALVKRILETHGCRIWVESEAGKGTTFLFTLPTKPETDSVI